MGIAKLIKDLTTWTTHTQKHWIEVQNDNETTSKKAELDWKVLRSMGVQVTNLSIGGGNTVRYTQIPLDGQRFLVTVTANIAPRINAGTINQVSTNVSIPVGLRPAHVEERVTFFRKTESGEYFIVDDRKHMAGIAVYGNDATGSNETAPGRVRIYNQHTFPRTLSITYISEPVQGQQIGL